MTELVEAAAVAGFIAAALRVAMPLLLAALGEAIAERAGVINLGIEGAMLTGALASAIGAVVAGP
ncbi:MAG: ABC transporter permease, partial [Gemmatimonadota bacterium]|nr:ABC transporter permease [Gemmatimonadota bacterium]